MLLTHHWAFDALVLLIILISSVELVSRPLSGRDLMLMNDL